VPPSSIHEFFGTDCPPDTLDEQGKSLGAQQEYKTFVETQANMRIAADQDADKAQCAFYGVDETDQAKAVKQLGEPIPGYSGVNRRIQADNVFGMTYAEARKMATESMGRINMEKSETLKETSMWKGTQA
jgi:hypothetical protein